MIGMILITVGILMYTLIPVLADLNRTHATNPNWPSHARFHVVTQVVTTFAIGVIALWYLWTPTIDRSTGMAISVVLSFAVLGGFFVSAMFKSLYSGELSDKEGGIPKTFSIDLNALNFGFSAVFIIAGSLVLP